MDEKPVNLVEQDKIVQILELFNSVSRIGKIRVEVFPKWFDNKSHLRITLSKIHKALANYIILLVLAWGNWDDYNRKRRNLKARLRYQKRKEDGTLADKASIKAAMKRDGHKCVITGSDEKLAVHHIDGNRSNNNLDNLVTLSKVVHQVIHNGARAYDDSSLEYWRQRKPEYVLDLKKRMDYMSRSVVYLGKAGYSDARVECISGEVLFGTEELHKKLNISPVSKRFRGSYNIVVLKPTGHRGEPEVYLPRTSYYDEIEGFEQKCEDCPHEGDPPCGDFNPGPYCFPAQEVDENPSCNNCMFNKTEGCPFIDIDQGDNGRPQICDQWHEIIEIE